MNTFPQVLVLLLNWNTKKMTAESIQSILNSDYPNYKIILIDNASTDDSVEYLRNIFKNRIEIIQTNENLGYARGMNYGLKYASRFSPDYFLIMNNDTKLDNHAISELVKTSQKHNNKCLVTGKVYHYDHPNVLQYVGSNIIDINTLKMKKICKDELDNGQYDNEEERDMIDDIFWLMPFKLYKEIGGYSPYFFMNAEQADLAMRAKKRGYKLIYTPKAKIWHKGSLSTGGRTTKNASMAYWNMKSSLIFRYLHLRKKYFLLYYLKIFKTITLSFIKEMLKKILKKNDSLLISYANLLGFLSFNKWLITKEEATSKTPFNKK